MVRLTLKKQFIVIAFLLITGCTLAYASPSARGVDFNASIIPGSAPASMQSILTAVPEKAAVTSGEPVVVKFIIENISGDFIRLTSTNCGWDFSLCIKDDKGREVALTAAGKKARYTYVIGMSGCTIPLGKKTDFDVEVSKLYDMSAPGKYTIVARRHVYEGGETVEREVQRYCTGKPVETVKRLQYQGGDKTIATSNIATVRVLPKKTTK